MEGENIIVFDKDQTKFRASLHSLQKRKQLLLEQIHAEQDEVRCILLLNCVRYL